MTLTRYFADYAWLGGDQVADRVLLEVARLTPDSYHGLARALYAEIALAGISCVGEFHYVHHGQGGSPYRDRNAMGDALVAAIKAVLP